jgi:hypothetical protein
LDLPTVTVPSGSIGAIGRGQSIGVPPGTGPLPSDQPLRLIDAAGELLAIGRLVGTKLAPDKVLIAADAG